MCMDGLVQLLMMLAKPRTKLVRSNWNAYYMLIMLPQGVAAQLDDGVSIAAV